MGNVYNHKIETLVRKSLPKVVERFNTQNNFELPYFEILSIDGWPSNFFATAMHGEEPKFHSLRINVLIDEKDGRIGRVKKLITKLVEQVVLSLNYEVETEDIYITFQTER
jgi:hypothetical protein